MSGAVQNQVIPLFQQNWVKGVSPLDKETFGDTPERYRSEHLGVCTFHCDFSNQTQADLSLLNPCPSHSTSESNWFWDEIFAMLLRILCILNYFSRANSLTCCLPVSSNFAPLNTCTGVFITSPWADRWVTQVMPTTAVAGGANWIVLPGFNVMAVVGCNSFCHGKALRWVFC